MKRLPCPCNSIQEDGEKKMFEIILKFEMSPSLNTKQRRIYDLNAKIKNNAKLHMEWNIFLVI